MIETLIFSVVFGAGAAAVLALVAVMAITAECALTKWLGGEK